MTLSQLMALAQALPIQLTLALAVVILATAILAWFPEVWLIQAQLDRQAWAQVEQGRRITQSLYRQQALANESLATYIAQLPELRQLLQVGTEQAAASRDLYLYLTLHLNLLENHANHDLLLVCDAQGNRVVLVGIPPEGELCATIERVGVRGEGVQLLPASGSPQAWWLTTMPIGSDLGILIIGKALNDQFAVQLHAQTGLEHTILVENQPVATSLARVGPWPANSFRSLLPLPSGRDAPTAGQTPITFMWHGVPYYASHATLLPPNLVDEVALDVSALSQVKQRILRSQTISMVIMGLTGIMAAMLLARHIGGALAKLAQAAIQFSAGDLESPVVVREGVREITQVAQSLEHARLDLRHMVAALQQEKAWGEHLLQAIVEGIATLDVGGRITFWSLGAERITGWRREQVLQRHCDEIFVPAFAQPKFSEMVAAMGKHNRCTVHLADGNQATLAIVGTPLLRGASTSHAAPLATNDREAEQVIMFRDISDEVAVQHLLGHFMANMTHEFRTPLSALAAAIELLMDQAPDLSPAEMHELLLSLHLGVVSLQTLVDNLLESTRLESGVFETFPCPTDLSEIVAISAQTMHPLLAKYGQRMTVNLPPTLPLVHADPQRTIQVLVNLLANSGKYGPSDTEVVIGATIADGHIRVTVADRGAGVPAHQRQKIFSRFVHFGVSAENPIPSASPNPRTPHASSRHGTGLGLWIVKNIVEAQGGEVGVDARPGGGAIFWFTLQIAEGTMSILIVDDDRVLADLISFTLRREHYEVICVHDGKGALIRCEQETPDLAVVDVNLPDTDGFALCQRLRGLTDIPVILLTVRSHEDDILRGFEVGADDYITKPFSPRQLVARARAVLRRAHTRVQRAPRQVSDWQFDPMRREITSATGESVLLSLLENQLLDYLIINNGQVVTFDTIINHLWGPEGGSASMVRQLVYRLRGKLHTTSPQLHHIHTVAGIGYEFHAISPA